MIDGWKNKGLGPTEIPEGDARAFGNGKGRELFPAYQDRLKTLNACDFGDLLMHPIAIFRQPGRAAGIPPEVQYILVDEYQDTNTAQYMWLRLLAQRPRRVQTLPHPAPLWRGPRRGGGEKGKRPTVPSPPRGRRAARRDCASQT